MAASSYSAIFYTCMDGRDQPDMHQPAGHIGLAPYYCRRFERHDMKPRLLYDRPKSRALSLLQVKKDLLKLWHDPYIPQQVMGPE